MSICVCVICGLPLLSSVAEPVAFINGSPIRGDAVRMTAARHGYNLHDPQSAEKALNDTLSFELLVAQAEKLGYFDHPEIIDMIKKRAVQKLVTEQIDQQLPKTILTEEELRSYYDTHPEAFTKPALVKGRILMILIRDDQEAEARRNISEAHALLRQGRSFAEVVQQYSDDAAARANGGMSNWIIQDKPNRRYPPEVTKALLHLDNTDETVGPIETERAYYLVKLAEKREGRITPYETAKKSISRKVYRQKRQEAYNAYCEQLKTEFEVEVQEDALSKITAETQAGAGPPSGPVRILAPTDPATAGKHTD